MALVHPLHAPKIISPQRPQGTPRIHSDLDESCLTIEAFRVLAHLWRRADPIISTNGEIRWAAYPSVRSIAEICFRGSYPESPIDYLRSKVIAAIAELQERGFVEVEHRYDPNAGTQTNIYYLHGSEEWQPYSPDLGGRNVRKGRKKVPPEPGSYPPDLPRITGGVIFGGGEGVISRGSQSISRSSKSIREREREAGGEIFGGSGGKSDQGQVEIDLFEPEPEETLLTSAPSAAGDQSSAAPPVPQNFDFRQFPWHLATIELLEALLPEFWEAMLQRTQKFADRRVARGGRPVFDIPEFALTKLRNEGATLYQEWLQSRLPLPIAPEEIRLTAAAPHPEPGRAADQAHTDLKLEQWHQAAATLTAMRMAGRQADFTAALTRTLRGGPGYPGDPDKVEWLCKTNPEWGVSFNRSTNQLEQTDATT